MDSKAFDREKIAVQDKLRAAGQDIEIPDPDSPDYLSTYLALQRTHPRLAARLLAAEQADPAELLDPYTERPPKVTAKHRWNAFVDKNFMRRGIDRKLVLDRQRVFRTGLYTLGGIVVAGLVWSVVAPKPTTGAAATAQTGTTTGQAAPSTPATTGTSGAFDAAGDTPSTTTPTTEAGSVTPAPKQEEHTFATSDVPPRPVTTATGTGSDTTPPPPAVFNQVAQNDPYTPVATSPEPAATSTPSPATPSYADSSPVPVASSPEANPVVRSAPFGGSETAARPTLTAAAQTTLPAPQPVNDTSTDLPSPFADAPASQPSGQASTTFTSGDAAQAPAEVSSPFGGETATAPSATAPAPSAQTPAEEQPARGAAMIYQAQRPEQTLPKSSMLYQRSASQSADERSVLVYTAQTSRDSGAATRVNASVQSSNGAGGGVSGGSLLYQGQRAAGTASGAGTAAGTGSSEAPSSPAAFAQAPDPDAPKFSPTSVIRGKLFSNIRTAASLAVPVIVVSQDGNWVGVASYNAQLGRVDMQFTSFVLNKNGKTYPVQALAFQAGNNGTVSEGVRASVHPIAPTLAVDIARAGINSLNTYSQALQNSGTTSVNGSLITTTRQAPELVQVIRGEIGKVFALPEGNVSIRVVADVAAGTEIQVVYGVSSAPSDQQGSLTP